ncbi:hypothetical protein EOL96_02015 [Candidatus Saccharibacteria bacterium]|nr:hypothetical protein [Candidatus Saccharibacteria bacterium]
MTSKNRAFSNKQLLFKELFVGTLIYVVVLGFLNDYSSIVYVDSFSTMFLASIVLQILTYFTFLLKGKIVAWLLPRPGKLYKALLFFSVWFVMFVSKFVFIWAIDIIFDDYIQINGFFGVLLVVLSVTLIHKTTDKIFIALKDDE